MTSPKILVIEDDTMVRMLLQQTLDEAGFSAEAYGHPKEGLEALKTNGFSIVISDLRLPGMDGLEVLEYVRTHYPNAVRILITAYGNTSTLAQAINRGLLFRYLSKPWTQEELLGIIRSAIEHYDLERSNERLRADKAELATRLEHANAELQDLNQELRTQITAQHAQLEALETMRREMAGQVEQTLDLCYQLQERNDPVLAIHTKSRVEISRRIARAAPLSAQDKHCLMISAWLCDLGLIGIPPAILDSSRKHPERLEGDDLALITNHPITSQQLATLVDSSDAVGRCIRAHHERHDGSGFPDQLRHDAIPLPARVLGIIVYLTESQEPHDVVLRTIERGAGTLFHPDAVRLVFRYGEISKAPHRLSEVVFDELKPGMRLANSLYGPTGLLLVAKDRVLDAAAIEHIKTYNQRNPLHPRIFIYR